MSQTTKLIVVIVLLYLATQLSSCTNSKPSEYELRYPVIDTIHISKQYEQRVNLYIIDSCEYIGSIRGAYSDYLTHKGNCKNHGRHN